MRLRIFSSLAVTATVSALVVCILVTRSAHKSSRRVLIHNEAGEQIKLDRVDPTTGQNSSRAESNLAGDTLSLDALVNHAILFCDMNSMVSALTVSPDQYEQMISIKKYPQLVLHVANESAAAAPPTNQQQAASDLVDRCRQAARASLALGLLPNVILPNLEKCLLDGTTQLLMTVQEELSFQRDLRRSLADQTESFTCSDPTLETTPPQRMTKWTYQNTTHYVGILHEHTASHIHIIEHFIEPEECRAIQDAAQPMLHRGTVADGKGGSTMSKNRKAWQAGIQTPFSPLEPASENPIVRVKQRLFAYANHAVGFNMTLSGQEDLMSIQYFGKNVPDEHIPTLTGTSDDCKNETCAWAPDQYMPHCDGDCTNTPHKTGGRVATMVMYCDVPDPGNGATNFQQANVYIKPTLGAAVFFAYMNPHTGIHDEGFTTHSGCPVRGGIKRIAVQWMRVGVDKENPWDSFDTNTVRKI
jgi:2OG-Fe(II) oxygenase superfamily